MTQNFFHFPESIVEHSLDCFKSNFMTVLNWVETSPQLDFSNLNHAVLERII